MAVGSNQVAVPTTVGGTQVIPPANTSWLPAQNDSEAPKRTIYVQNQGSATVYLGASGVSSSTGFPLAAGVSATLTLFPDESLYAISATGTQTVAYLSSGG